MAFYAASALGFFFSWQSTPAFEQFVPVSGILSLRGCGWYRGSFIGWLPLRGFNKADGRRVRTVVAAVL